MGGIHRSERLSHPEGNPAIRSAATNLGGDTHREQIGAAKTVRGHGRRGIKCHLEIRRSRTPMTNRASSWLMTRFPSRLGSDYRARESGWTRTSATNSKLAPRERLERPTQRIEAVCSVL